MAFTNSAQAAVANLPENEPMRMVLDYLLEHGRGRAHAQPWHQIAAHLQEQGIEMDQKKFQQGILKQTREGEIFIGSNDHNPRGYFLIEDIQDANITLEFYDRRIASQEANRAHLHQLIEEQWPNN